eukprot:TRINITY_DN13045_c0_g1_i1.p1 TRINITY_DN13045_c0_g1~~TRINITY_DN13045_c0_g1_i1.p1  ORF type:complete len:263 (+),score=9.43 TRINITY_DN13045_c0_g1_i1:60-848(+)
MSSLVDGCHGRRRRERQMETDSHRLAQRQKQIMYGENTPGYDNLMRALERDPSLRRQALPVKPSLLQKCSKRSWDGQVRKWRRGLHMFDLNRGEHVVEQDLVSEPTASNVISRIRYTTQDLFDLAESPLVTETVHLAEDLQWLDKCVDLDDDFEDDVSLVSFQPSPLPNRSGPHPVSTPARLFTQAPPATPIQCLSPVPGPSPAWGDCTLPDTPNERLLLVTPLGVRRKPNEEQNKENAAPNRLIFTPPRHRSQLRQPFQSC